nr:MAG TPA: holin [Caudoviricetes sp.]
MAKHLKEKQMTNKSYDILKWVALVALPATSALYLTLAALWNLPYPTEVAGTIAAIDTFLGVLLGVSSNKYTGNQPSGALHVDESQGIHATFDQGVGEMLRNGKVTLDVKQV